MSAKGLEVLDRAVHKAHEWINELRALLDWGSDQNALRLLRVTLHQIRDRIHVSETAQLSAQLPMMIRGMFLEGWKPDLAPLPDRRAVDLIKAVENHVGDVVEYRGQQDIITVFKFLNSRISPEQINDVRGNLPKDIRALWPEPQRTRVV